MQKLRTDGARPGRSDFLGRFQEESERWRLRYFLSSGFQAMEGALFVTYRVMMAEGVSEESLYRRLKEILGDDEIPPIMPEAARGRTIGLFRRAEEEKLIILEETMRSRAAPAR